MRTRGFGGGGGVSNFYVPASAMIPRVTNGCGVNSSETSSYKINYDTLDFDASTQQYAQFECVMPSNYSGGPVKARFYWLADSGSGDVVWSFGVASIIDGDNLDVDNFTASVTDTLQSSKLCITNLTAAVVTGVSSASKLVLFQVSRVAADSGDTLAVNARLRGVEVSF
jgi:hypothetical protein